MTANTSEELSELTPHKLIAEIQEIAAQYAVEVPGTCGNGLEGIRAGVLALAKLGISNWGIAELTGIPSATVFLLVPRPAPRPTAAARLLS